MVNDIGIFFIVGLTISLPSNLVLGGKEEKYLGISNSIKSSLVIYSDLLFSKNEIKIGSLVKFSFLINFYFKLSVLYLFYLKPILYLKTVRYRHAENIISAKLNDHILKLLKGDFK